MNQVFRLFFILIGFGILPFALRAQQHLPPLETQAEDSLRINRSLPDPFSKEMVSIERVLILGNKKTRREVIEREMSIRSGDLIAYDELKALLQEEEKRINNTRLFTYVNVEPLPLSGRRFDILVEVRERWYIIPAPIFRLADRNLNDWWTNQKRDISRVNLGMRFTHYNFRGRNEKLAMLAQFGFTQSYSLSYYRPVIDKTRKNGAGIGMYFAEYDNLPLRTINHKRQFISAERPIQKRWGASFSFTRRASFYNTHQASLGFDASWTADTLLFENPEYIPDQRGNVMRAFRLAYSFRRDMRDVISYPLDGFLIQARVEKTGLGFYNDYDLFDADFSYLHFTPLPLKNFFLANQFSARLSTPQIQPYQKVTGLGYSGIYVRGYELYVIEGQHHLLNRTDLKFRALSERINLGRFMPIEEFRIFPISIYPKLYFDAAYVSSLKQYPQNDLLVDRLIWGVGGGLDLVSFYDFVMRLEVSRNSLNETGFFLHFKSGF